MLLRLLILVLLFTWSPPALACIWDTDTLLAERSRFPTALELMTGKFIRHTPELYAWRLRDRSAKIAANPDDLSLVDDLAVAHDKLGDHAAAIAAMEAILPRDPRRYETLANLGTFYLHNGDFTKGIEFIDRALEVNPDAHFGRERYQRWLAEYILEHRGDDGELALPLFARTPGAGTTAVGDPRRRAPGAAGGFADFLQTKLGVPYLKVSDVEVAIHGVLGMMRFGQHDSPLLLEALGDLLSANIGHHDGKRLAARAYLLAGEAAGDPRARALYEARVKLVLSQQDSEKRERLSLTEVKEALAKERAEADAWYADLEAREHTWLNTGVDPEAKIRELYAEEIKITGKISRPKTPRPHKPLDRSKFRRAKADAEEPSAIPWPLVLGTVGIGLAALAVGIRLRRRSLPR